MCVFVPNSIKREQRSVGWPKTLIKPLPCGTEQEQIFSGLMDNCVAKSMCIETGLFACGLIVAAATIVVDKNKQLRYVSLKVVGLVLNSSTFSVCFCRVN